MSSSRLSLDSERSAASSHISIDLTPDTPTPFRPPPHVPTAYPPHLASPRDNSFDWDCFPATSVQTSSSRSTSTSSTYHQGLPAASVASSSTSTGDVEAAEEDHGAFELSSVARGKRRASHPYGDVEGAATDGEEGDGQPMLGGRSSAEGGNRRTPKGQRAATAAAARHRRRVVAIAMVAGVLVVLAMAGRDRIPRFERWRSGSAPSSGGNGSTIRMEDGSEFIYSNEFGGIWNSTPFSTSAIAQADTPPLSEPWDYSTQRIYGVNLGGWLTLEPFITPALFEPFLNASTPAVDEWTLSENLGVRLAEVVEHHYATFITEQDFARIAGAGLNWVRIAVPFWAVEVRKGEPFLAYVSWRYFLKAMTWARKYGIRINLDLHTVPGSQNGWNHSGKYGPVGFLNGVMGIANAQRTLNLIRSITEFLSMPEKAEVVPMFSVLNEPFMETIGSFALRSFYFEAYRTVRAASGLGEGHGPMITFHDGFKGTARWYGFLPGADRVALDSHRYLAFRDSNLDSMDLQALKPCFNWATDFNRTMAQVGVAMTGEWSVAVNDCGRFLNGVGLGTRFEGTFPYASEPNGPGASPVGGCEKWEDFMSWDDELKDGLKQVALAHMDAFQNWFYWTWKTSNSLLSPNPSLPSNPIWSYSLGLEHGYTPSDPRSSIGFCDANAKAHDVPPPKRFRFNRPLYDWQVGRGPVEELGRINTTRADAEGWNTFPPEWAGRGEARLRSEELPRLVRGEGRTGAVKLEGPKPPGAVDVDWRVEEGWWIEQEGCDYLSPWEGVGAEVPKGACTSLVSES